MKFAITLAIAMVALGACSSFKKGKVVQSSDREIRIAISYDAANQGVDTFRQASEHCADDDHVAVWYGTTRTAIWCIAANKRRGQR